MKKLIIVFLCIASLSTFPDSEKERMHPVPLSIFDINPLNSPVKGSVARFLLEAPKDFKIKEVQFRVRNASRLFEKDQPLQKINLIDGPEGKELHISVSKFPTGFYQLFVKVKGQKNKEYDYKNKYRDHIMFVVDSSLQVPMPDPKLNDKTIAGIDSDGDGIRDDIQRWINEKCKDKPRTQLALKQIAMSMQLDLISSSNKEQSTIAGRKMLKDLDCLSYIVGLDEEIKIADEIKSKMLNTKDRHYAEIRSNANYSGQSIPVSIKTEDTKATCEFNPDNL